MPTNALAHLLLAALLLGGCYNEEIAGNNGTMGTLHLERVLGECAAPEPVQEICYSGQCWTQGLTSGTHRLRIAQRIRFRDRTLEGTSRGYLDRSIPAVGTFTVTPPEAASAVLIGECGTHLSLDLEVHQAGPFVLHLASEGFEDEWEMAGIDACPAETFDCSGPADTLADCCCRPFPNTGPFGDTAPICM